MFDKELLKTIDPTKVSHVKFNFAELDEIEIAKLRKQGVPDEEICKIANERLKVA